jgi:predicted nucleic acid-binding protein
LESVCRGNSTVGSNPTLSAIFARLRLARWRLASLHRTGRKVNARPYDARIAATAIANGLPVYTSNPNDFAGIEGLQVDPVPVPQQSPARDEAVD